MKKLLTLLLASVLLAGTSGCKDKKDAEQAPAGEAQQQEQAVEPAVEEEVVEEEPAEEEEAVEEEVVVDEAMYIKAAYEVTCVKAKIDNPEEQKEILEQIYPRYGFETVEEFATAESSLKDSASVKAAIASKMEGCTVEVAKGFKTAGATEEKPAEEEEAKKPSAPKAAYKDSTYVGNLSANGITDGRLTCSIFKGKANCSVVGKAEGRAFSVPTQGTIDKSGNFSVSGERSNNKASVKGRVRGSKATGQVTLTVFSRDYSGSWSSN